MKEQDKEPDYSTAEYEELLKESKVQKYVLKLYITGMTPRSMESIRNIKEICEKYLKGRYELEVIDVNQQPSLAKGEQIIAAPTLIKKLPVPLRKFIGDMSNKEKIVLGLDLKPKSS